MLAISPDERLTPARRAKLAYIYVRQSSVTQGKHHQESTELQYRLVDRAIGLGWPRERVQVIDEDLGKSHVVLDHEDAAPPSVERAARVCAARWTLEFSCS